MREPVYDVRTACLRDAIRDLQQCTFQGDPFDARFREVLRTLYEIRADLAVLGSGRDTMTEGASNG